MYREALLKPNNKVSSKVSMIRKSTIQFSILSQQDLYRVPGKIINNELLVIGSKKMYLLIDFLLFGYIVSF